MSIACTVRSITGLLSPSSPVLVLGRGTSGWMRSPALGESTSFRIAHTTTLERTTANTLKMSGSAASVSHCVCSV